MLLTDQVLEEEFLCPPEMCFARQISVWHWLVLERLFKEPEIWDTGKDPQNALLFGMSLWVPQILTNLNRLF